MESPVRSVESTAGSRENRAEEQTSPISPRFEAKSYLQRQVKELSCADEDEAQEKVSKRLQLKQERAKKKRYAVVTSFVYRFVYSLFYSSSTASRSVVLLLSLPLIGFMTGRTPHFYVLNPDQPCECPVRHQYSKTKFLEGHFLISDDYYCPAQSVLCDGHRGSRFVGIAGIPSFNGDGRVSQRG